MNLQFGLVSFVVCLATTMNKFAIFKIIRVFPANRFLCFARVTARLIMLSSDQNMYRFLLEFSI